MIRQKYTEQLLQNSDLKKSNQSEINVIKLHENNELMKTSYSDNDVKVAELGVILLDSK